MKLQHPNPVFQIPVSQHTYAQLLGGAVGSAGEREEWQVLEEAVEEWTCRHNPEGLAKPANSGFQWKKLFLPSGTVLRTMFNGENHHCLVEDDKIFYGGRAVSPSGFVNAVGGIRRNAWKCLWIRLPNTGEWRLADTLRQRERPRQARAAPEAVKAAPLPIPPTTPTTANTCTPAAPLAAAAGAHQCQCACAAAGVPRHQATVAGDRRAPGSNVVALPLRGVQRVGRFRGHKSRIAGVVPAARPNSLQDVAAALRRSEAQRTAAWPAPNQKHERLFVAWFGSEEGFPMST
ncbi:MAG: hypothetical protein V4857_16710 [Pseudomonadota bacterium]